MPIPFLIPIGAALLAGGMGAQMMGSRQAQKAMQNRLAAEAARQRQFDEALAATNAASLQKFQNTTTAATPEQDSQLGQQQKSLNDRYQSAIQSQLGSYLPGAGATTAPSVVTSAFDRASRESEDRVRSQAEAWSRVGSLGAFLGDRAVDLNRSGQDVAMNRNFSQGSQNVLPIELQAASQRGSGLRTLGSILSGVGSLALTGGLAGAGGPAVATGGGVGGLTPVAAPAAAGGPLAAFNPGMLRVTPMLF